MINSPLPAEDIQRRAIGTDALLKALWREHPGILRSLAQSGLMVVRPGASA